MTPINTQPNIELTLDGLITVFVDPKNEKCTAGVLREVPVGHSLSIKVFQPNAAGEFELIREIEEINVKDKLELKVSNTSQTGISRRKMDAVIDRLGGASIENNDSYRWVVDLESEIYKKPIGAKKTGFASVLTVNTGELLARTLSKNSLIIRKGKKGTPKRFGRVATQTGIDIFLDQPKSTAVFKNGDEVIFEADSKSRLRVIISRGCTTQSSRNDADFYYTAVGGLVPEGEKIFFSSDPLPAPNTPAPVPVTLRPPNTPDDASCLGTRMSQSSI